MIKIALIDDEKEMIEEMKDYLEYREYAVVLATDAKSGMALLESTPVDLVLLDMTMPGTSGIEILRRFRIERPHLKFIVMTGRSDETTRNEVLAEGASYYLGKPFGLEDLDRAIEKVMEVKKP